MSANVSLKFNYYCTSIDIQHLPLTQTIRVTRAQNTKLSVKHNVLLQAEYSLLIAKYFTSTKQRFAMRNYQKWPVILSVSTILPGRCNLLVVSASKLLSVIHLSDYCPGGTCPYLLSSFYIIAQPVQANWYQSSGRPDLSAYSARLGWCRTLLYSKRQIFKRVPKLDLDNDILVPI